jgi:ribosomal protein S27AE
MSDYDFLLYPLETGEDPRCLNCGILTALATHEAREMKPDFITFRCAKCGRSERFVCEE